MKQSVIIFLFSLILLANVTFAITVDGYAYLENQTQHDSIEVYFEMVAPNDSTYTTVTDISGYYNVEIEQGFYDITYSKNGYYPSYVYDEVIYTTQTLQQIDVYGNLYVPLNAPTIQGALSLLEPNDTIFVEDGIYYEDLYWVNKEGVKLIGNSRENTIIDGNGLNTVITFNNSIVDSTTIIKNFTIQNGNADNGGGIFCVGYASPTIENLTIKNNTAEQGGGIYCNNNSNPSFDDVLITNNTASNEGGGIYCDDNSNFIFEDLEISNNFASNKGGGIMCSFSNPSLTDIIIKNNTTTGQGGGIYFYISNPNVQNVTISDNSANRGGGVFCSGNANPEFKNVIIKNNIASSNGGGIFCWLTHPSFINLTIYGNSASENGGVKSKFVCKFLILDFTQFS